MADRIVNEIVYDIRCQHNRFRWGIGCSARSAALAAAQSTRLVLVSA